MLSPFTFKLTVFKEHKVVSEVVSFAGNPTVSELKQDRAKCGDICEPN